MLLEYNPIIQDLANNISPGKRLSSKWIDSLGSRLPISQAYQSSTCWPFHFEDLIKVTLEQSLI